MTEKDTDKRTRGTLITIPWDGRMELRTSDNSEIGVAILGSTEHGAIPNGRTRDNARRIVSLWNAAEELKISTEAVKGGALQKAFKACDDADTAFAVINLCDDLTPQARKALKEAWASVQEALIALKPDSAYAQAVQGCSSAFNLAKQKKGLYLELFHGRKSPEQEMDDWGEQGPIFGPYAYVHTTYSCDIKLGKENDDPDELSIIDGLVYYDGIYYGDWSVYSETVIKDLPDDRLKSFHQEYDDAKAKTSVVEALNAEPVEEEEPFIWLQSDEPEGVAVCGCRLGFIGADPAVWLCPKHKAVRG